MSRRLLLFAALLGLGCSNAKPTPDDDKAVTTATATQSSSIGFRSAKIEFAHTGWKRGTTLAWIGDEGKTVILVSDFRIPIREQKTVVWKDGRSTFWDLASPEPRVSVTSARPRDTVLRLVAETDPEKMQRLGYRRQPDDVVAGKTCAVWRNDDLDVTIWRWGAIDLKYVNGAVKNARSEMEAVRVELDVDIPASAYTPPSKLPVKED